MFRSVPIACGSYLPQKIVTNDHMAEHVETSHQWIVQRTGIEKRHFAAEGEYTSDLATQAAQKALDNAGLKASDIDLLVLATATPDETFPATATIVQQKLGMTQGFAFDVGAVCAGFLAALNVADNFIKSGQIKKALIIGAETFSRILDMKDRSTCVLFGDGAGALILGAEDGLPTKTESGVLGVHMQSDGRFHDILYMDGGPSTTGHVGCVRMVGRDVFRNAVSKLVESATTTLERHDVDKSEVDWLIPHQANIRIINGLADKFGIPHDRVVRTVNEHANTSAASIPLALDHIYGQGKLKKGDLILHDAIGGGLAWGSALVRW